MEMISSFRLVKVEDGYDLELFMDNPAMDDVEFAEEFGRIDPDNRQRLNRNILDFIAGRFPGIKIRMVKVMAGSLLLASFLYTAPIQAQAAGNAASPAQSTQTAQESAYDYSARVSINGQLQSFSSKPFFYNYTTYVNLYEFGNKIGASVWWNDASNTVGINKNGVQIAFMRGSSIARVNGKQVSMPKSLVVNGVTYAPLKFIAENLGYQVTLDSATNTVMVGSRTTQAGNAGVYTVVAGDTLWSIAQRHQTSVDTLKRINDLTSDVIYPGQALKLYRTHPVKSGDTLWRIAQSYGVDVADIKKANNLSSDTILVGQSLIIPGTASAIPPASEKPSPVTAWPAVTYIVQAGDTASAIAKKFDVSLQDLMRYNYKEPDEWFNAGEKIAISGYAPRAYTVTPGQDSAPARKGALVDWQTEGKYLIKGNSIFTIVDVETGKQFKAVMIGGSNHADIEPATRADTRIMKEIFGTWKWSPRAVVVYINGMNLAASLSGMPHGADTVTDNDVNGMFDMYLKGSTSHSTSTSKVYIQEHANMVLKAAGL